MKYKKRFIALVIIIILLIAVYCISLSTIASEFFSTYISRIYIFVVGGFFSFIKISFYEIVMFGLLIFVPSFIIYQIIMLIRKKHKKAFSAFLNVTIFILVNVLSAFIAIVPGYNREYLVLPSYNDLSDESFVEAAEFFSNDFFILSAKFPRDENGLIISPYTFNELNDLLNEEYDRVSLVLKDGFISNNFVVIKEVKTPIMAYTGIAGIFFANFGESNVSSTVPSVFLPHTMAHEMAHCKGIMREYEANLIAYYLQLTSENEYLRYTGYLSSYFYYIMRPLEKVDKVIKDKINDEVPQTIKTELDESYKIYDKYKNIISEIGNKINDLYLKFNKQDNGSGSYHNSGQIIIKEEENEQGVIVEIPKYEYSETERIIASIYVLKNK